MKRRHTQHARRARHSRKIMVGLLLVLLGCTNNKPPREPDASGSMRTNESANAEAEIRVPTVVEVEAILALQERIMQQPQDEALRRELGQKAIDVNAGIAWSVGRGKFPRAVASPNVARNQAELAARVEASRWAAYLRAWQKNDYATRFGEIHGQVPSGEVVSTTVVDSVCVVLLKTSLR